MQNMRNPLRSDTRIDYETYYNIIANIKELYSRQDSGFNNFRDIIRIAKITGSVENSEYTSYTGVEVTWDGTEFILLEGTPGWDSNAEEPYPFLDLIPLMQNSVYTVDDIVFVIRDPHNKPQWIIVGGGGGSGGVYLVKIKSLHANSGPEGGSYRCVYLADIYGGGKGLDDPPTTEDVTVVCDDIAVGVIIPVGTACQAITATRSWQMSDGEYSDAESVYLVEIPRWL